MDPIRKHHETEEEFVERLAFLEFRKRPPLVERLRLQAGDSPEWNAWLDRAAPRMPGDLVAPDPQARPCHLDFGPFRIPFHSARAAARFVGVPQATMLRWLHGKTPWPKSARRRQWIGLTGGFGPE